MEAKQLSLFNYPEFVCQFCGKDTSEIEYDYLIGTNHLVCFLEDGMEDSSSEIMERRQSLFTISRELVYNTPNDQELGKKVRQIYNELKD